MTTMRTITIVAAGATVLGLASLPLIGQRGDGQDSALAAADATTPGTTLATRTSESAQEDWRWAGRIAQGKTIEINGVFGHVRAEATSGDQVEVVATNPSNLPIRVVEHEGGVTICPVYPVDADAEGGLSMQHSERHEIDVDEEDAEVDGAVVINVGEGDDSAPNECAPGGWRNLRIDEDQEDTRVDFVVRVPAGVRLAAATVDGDVTAEGLRSAVKAASVAGEVRVSTSEEAEASSVSGNVNVSMGRIPRGDVSIASVSGDIDLRLPANAGAELRANTLSGEIETDFELESEPMVRAGGEDNAWGVDVRIGQKATGRIGAGGPSLELTTVSGNIRVSRGR